MGRDKYQRELIAHRIQNIFWGKFRMLTISPGMYIVEGQETPTWSRQWLGTVTSFCAPCGCPTPNLFGVEHDQRREEGEEKRWAGQNREKPAQKVMKKIGQRIKQEQKRKSVGKISLINFLKRKVLSMTVKREEKGSRNERISYKKRRAKEDK